MSDADDDYAGGGGGDDGGSDGERPKKKAKKEKAPAKAAAAAGKKAKPAAAAVATAAPAKSSAAAGGGAGAPKKCTTEREAEEVILHYMLEANRPYSGQNVFDNLHGAVPKAMVPRILDKLSSAGGDDAPPPLVAKAFGKANVYWANQAALGGAVEPAQLDELRVEEKEAAAAAGAAATHRRELSSQLSALSSGMSPAETAAAIAALEAKTAAATAKLEKMTSASAPLVTPEARRAAIATLERYRKAWASRKSAVMEVVDAVCEGLGKKPAAVAEQLGLETDEEAKASIKDVALPPPPMRPRAPAGGPGGGSGGGGGGAAAAAAARG